MNTKKANWLFLSIIVLTIGVELLLSITGIGQNLSRVQGMFLSEGMILIPCLIFLLFHKEPMNMTLGFHKVKISTLLLVVVYTWCMSPLVTLTNLFSMIFVENEISAITPELMTMSFPMLFFLTAINAPFCEEFVFRGAIYGSYRKKGTSIKAMVVSALLFGLMHMNFNQAAYAFVIGIIMCLAYEATGSLFSTMVIHFVINAKSTLLIGITELIDPEQLTSAEESYDSLENLGMTTGQLYGAMAIGLLFVAVITTTIGLCLLYYIAKRCGRERYLQYLWTSRKEKHEKVVTIPLIIAMIICVAFMILTL